MLALSTVLVSLISDYMVASIQAVSERWNVNRSFLAIILIPIVGISSQKQQKRKIFDKGIGPIFQNCK